MLWLAMQAGKHHRIVEVGSFLGDSARAMAEATDGVVHCVDTWSPRDLPDNAHYAALREENRLMERFESNVGELIDAHKIYPFRGTSLEGARRFQDGSLDMVFIDASHDYESVKADILAWKPKLKAGGLLCGHDFEPHRGVPQAVKELVPDYKRGPGSLWYA